jgi:predicted esterase
MAFAMINPALAQETPQQIGAAVEAAYHAKDYDKAIELNRKLIEFQPDDGRHSFNMACLFSLKGEPRVAGEWLQKAVKQGFRELDSIKGDADLTSIRETDAYKAVIAELEAGVFSFEKAAAASKPLIVVPAGLDKDKPAPLIVAMHPYGGTAEWIVDKWSKVAADAGAILVAPRAVREVSGRDGFSWGATDEADELLTRAVKIAQESHKIDKSKTVLTGFSQGANMALTLGVRHADLFTGIIPVAGRYSPKLAEQLKDAKPRFYLMVGSKDRVVDSNKKADEELEAAGIKSRVVVYDGLGHAFPDPYEPELKKALEFVWGE